MNSARPATARLAANILVFCAALCLTPVASAVGFMGYTWQDMHGFVLPHLFLSLALAVFFGWSMAAARPGDEAERLGCWLQPLTAATYWWAMWQWPGGDDGGGMFWQLIVGPITALPMVLTAWSALRPHRRQETSLTADGSPSNLRSPRVLFCVAAAGAFSLAVALPWLDIALSWLGYRADLTGSV